MSCNRNYCKTESFFSIYQTRFEANKLGDDFVKNDLELKQKIFSTLCISRVIKKILIVEYGSATQSFFSRGLLFTYDDSKTYNYRIKDGKVIASKGSNDYFDLNKILLTVKKDFSSAKTKMDMSYDDFADAPIVNVLLYDSLMPQKFDRFSFPIVVWDSLHSR